MPDSFQIKDSSLTLWREVEELSSSWVWAKPTKRIPKKAKRSFALIGARKACGESPKAIR